MIRRDPLWLYGVAGMFMLEVLGGRTGGRNDLAAWSKRLRGLSLTPDKSTYRGHARDWTLHKPVTTVGC